jgi:hypothetical protein
MGKLLQTPITSTFSQKTFPCLFPWGTEGPKKMTMSAEEEPIDQDTEGGYGVDSDTQRSKNANGQVRKPPDQ